MAKVGRYSSCPMAGKIRGNRKTFREWLISRIRRRERPDVFMISNCYPAFYPSGYIKVSFGNGHIRKGQKPHLTGDL